MKGHARRATRGNQRPGSGGTRGASCDGLFNRPLHVGHFSVRARQLTSQAKGEETIPHRSIQRAREHPGFRALCRVRVDKGKMMSGQVYILREDDFSGEFHRRIYLLMIKKRRAWQSAGAAFGIAAGMLSLLLAVLLWAVVRFLAAGGPVSTLHTLEIIFFVLPLPLLALGVHCLDLLEKEPPALPLPARSQPADFRRRRSLSLRPQHPHNN